MATKERLHKLIDSLPDTPETDLRLDSVVEDLEPNGAGAGEKPIVDGPIPTFEESIAILANFDFLPREDAWH